MSEDTRTKTWTEIKAKGRSAEQIARLDAEVEIRARNAARTQGTWAIEREEIDAEDFSDEEQDAAFFAQIGPWSIDGHTDLGDLLKADQIEADAAFMENAGEDIAFLLAEIERLREDRNLDSMSRYLDEAGHQRDTAERQRDEVQALREHEIRRIADLEAQLTGAREACAQVAEKLIAELMSPDQTTALVAKTLIVQQSIAIDRAGYDVNAPSLAMAAAKIIATRIRARP